MMFVKRDDYLRCSLGSPIKSSPLEKFIISVIKNDFVAKFTVFIEEDSGHIWSKFCYNIWFSLKSTYI